MDSIRSVKADEAGPSFPKERSAAEPESGTASTRFALAPLNRLPQRRLVA